MRTPLPLVTALCIGALAARAGVIYETGFEPPNFALGGINGQEGWTGDGIIENTVVRSGTQALEMSLENGGVLPLAILGLNAAAKPQVNLQVDMRLEGDFDARAGLILLMTGGFGPQLIADGTGPVILDQNPTQGTLTTGQWYTLGLSLDFQARTVAAYLDGSWVGSAPLVPDGDRITEVWLAGGIEESGQRAYFDNLSIVAVPESPVMAAVVGLGLAGIALVRRRR